MAQAETVPVLLDYLKPIDWNLTLDTYSHALPSMQGSSPWWIT